MHPPRVYLVSVWLSIDPRQPFRAMARAVDEETASSFDDAAELAAFLARGGKPPPRSSATQELRDEPPDH